MAGSRPAARMTDKSSSEKKFRSVEQINSDFVFIGPGLVPPLLPGQKDAEVRNSTTITVAAAATSLGERREPPGRSSRLLLPCVAHPCLNGLSCESAGSKAERRRGFQSWCAVEIRLHSSANLMSPAVADRLRKAIARRVSLQIELLVSNSRLIFLVLDLCV
jgi:hypothetical protein